MNDRPLTKADADAILSSLGEDSSDPKLTEAEQSSVRIALYVREEYRLNERTRKKTRMTEEVNYGGDDVPPPPEGKGPGSPSCPTCRGSGVVQLTVDVLPVFQTCQCVHLKQLIRNMERTWSGLSKAEKLPKGNKNPLDPFRQKNLWVTSPPETFRSLLKDMMLQQAATWRVQVCTDADLMRAWLGSAVLKGAEILDSDVINNSVNLGHLTLTDLIEPPSLLIIRLGVKSSRNSAMGEVFYETLSHRAHLQKPTWVFDQPNHPLDFNHLCYSTEAVDFISPWSRQILGGKQTVNLSVPSEVSGMPEAPPARMTLSQGSGGARAVERTIPQPKKKKPYGGFTK